MRDGLLLQITDCGDGTYPGGKAEKQTRSVVKGLTPEMIFRTFKDHNLGGQPKTVHVHWCRGAKKLKKYMVRLYI